MTYQEVNDRLTRVQTALQSLQDGSYANNTSINVPQMTSQLQEVESKLKEQLAVIAEQEKGMVATDDESQAEKLAKKGVNVKLTKEERGEARFNVDETKEIAKEVGKAVAKALKTAGDEIAHMKATDIEESSFEIQVEFKGGELDQYSFYIDGEELHLVDFSFNKVVGDVGIKPSGEPIVHVDVIANNLVKHFKSTMKEDNEGDNYTLFLDMFKRLKKKLPSHHPQYKEMLAKVKKAMDQKGIDSSMIQEMSDEEFADAQEKERLDKHPEKTTKEKIQALIAREKGLKEKQGASAEEEEKFHKKLDTLVHNTFGKRPEEREMNEAPEGIYYIKIPKDAASQNKAQVIFDDLYGIKYEINDDPKGIVMYFKKEDFDAGVIDDLEGDGVQILDTNVPMNEVDVKEQDGGDLDVGHQDDEPNMLKKDLYDIATYAAKLYKQLDKYDKHDGEVDFPHWWQKKVTLAREYISSAQHFLEAEEKQPALDQLALEESKLNEIADPSYADMLAQFIILMGSGYGALQAVKKLGDETGDISLDSVKKAIKKYKNEDGVVKESLNPEVSKAVARFIKAMAKRYGYEEQDAVYAIMAALKQRDFDGLGESVNEVASRTAVEIGGLTGINKDAIQKKMIKMFSEAKIKMNNLDWGKSTAERNANLDKYDSLKTNKEKEAFLRKLKGENVKEGAKEEGEMAATKGKKYDENPYEKGTQDYLDWSKGHNSSRARKLDMNEQTVADLKPGDKFEFNGNEYTFVELYPELPNAARVVLPNGRKTVISFGGGKVNTGKKADIGPDAFGQGKGHHIDEAQSTCCGKCGRKHVKGTKCKTPYLKGKDHCRTR